MTEPARKRSSRTGLKRAGRAIDLLDKGYTILAFLVLGTLIILAGIYYLVTALF